MNHHHYRYPSLKLSFTKMLDEKVYFIRSDFSTGLLFLFVRNNDQIRIEMGQNDSISYFIFASSIIIRSFH